MSSLIGLIMGSFYSMYKVIFSADQKMDGQTHGQMKPRAAGRQTCFRVLLVRRPLSSMPTQTSTSPVRVHNFFDITVFRSNLGMDGHGHWENKPVGLPQQLLRLPESEVMVGNESKTDKFHVGVQW